MAAYVIANVDVKDPAAFEEYRKLVPATIQKYGGKYVVRGGTHEKLEGGWQPKRLVILEFPSRGHAQAFLADPEAQDLFARRHRSTTSRLVMVDGED